GTGRSLRGGTALPSVRCNVPRFQSFELRESLRGQSVFGNPVAGATLRVTNGGLASGPLARRAFIRTAPLGFGGVSSAGAAGRAPEPLRSPPGPDVAGRPALRCAASSAAGSRCAESA